MKTTLEEQNFLMEKIIRNYGSLIKAAVNKATSGQPYGDDILSEVYFAIFLTVRKLGTDWTPPRSFIFTIVRNKVNDFLRQKYKEKHGVEEMKKRLEEQASEKDDVVSKIHCLTYSEFRVFRLLGLGLTNNEIAQSLYVSLFTIRSHMKKIHAKCGVRDRTKLAIISHQVCFRGQTENLEEGRVPQEDLPLRHENTQRPPNGGQQELWEPDSSLRPIAVELWTRYFS